MIWRRALVPVLSLLALLGVDWLTPKLTSLPLGRLLGRILAKAQSRDLNKIDLDSLTAGYYQEILNEAERGPTGGGLLSRTGLVGKAEEQPEDDEVFDKRKWRRSPYLGWEYWPSSDLILPGAAGRLLTNRHGMADREYSLDKPRETRRIAVLGDSIIRGWGVPPGSSFEALLEQRLNDAHRSSSVQGFEVLNFATDGYRITQVLDVAVEKAPPFQPDVYLVALSDVSVLRRWGTHIGVLVRTGADLKYDYLRQLVQQAGLTREDEMYEIDSKLVPHRLPTLRWVLREIKAQAERQGASVIVVLVPSVSESTLVRSGFEGVPEIARDAGLPVIDLLDSFSEVSDLSDFRITGQDRHPNTRGHQLLFEKLYRQILADPQLSKLVLGPNPS